MALLTPTQLATMDYAFQGQPFVDVPAKDAVDIKTMDYAYQAQPFVRNYGAAVVLPATITGISSITGLSTITL